MDLREIQSNNLRKEVEQFEVKKKRLLDLYSSGGITMEEYNTKVQEFKMSKDETERMLETLDSHPDKFRLSLEYLMKLSRAMPVVFEKSSNFLLLNRLVGILSSNYTLIDGKLRYDLKKPLNEFAECGDHSNWLPKPGVFRHVRIDPEIQISHRLKLKLRDA